MSDEWCRHPKLQGRLDPDDPGHVRVLIHEGGPAISRRKPELLRVRVAGVDGDVFRGVLADRPAYLSKVRQGDEVRFVVPEGGGHPPILVNEHYVRQRPDWVINPCRRCGFTELLDPPALLVASAKLLRVIFSKQPKEEIERRYTAYCPLCGGEQGFRPREG